MRERLVYDVGVNDGADSAYYLACGCRVVGIEASPVLAEQLQTRFAEEIASGAFILLNVAVGEAEGEAEFWLSERSEWSSFSRDMAARDGLQVRPVIVPTRTFGSIVAEYGPAYYCKIDIEGYDRTCLQGLTPELAPTYLSTELNPQTALDDFKFLRGLGFTRFKIISQLTRSQASPVLMSLAYVLPWRLSSVVRGANRRFRGVEQVGSWRFAPNSSGPFGEDTPGRWESFGEAVRRWRFIRASERRFEAKGMHDWFDLHAAR